MMFFHWVGDFLLQTDWMAQNKKDDFLALVTHSLIWSATVTFGALVLNLFSVPEDFFAAFVGLAVSHAIIDWITSNINSRLWKDNRIHDFFVSVGFDQWLHLGQIGCVIETFSK